MFDYETYDFDVEVSKSDYLHRQNAQQAVRVRTAIPVINRERNVSQTDTETSSNEGKNSLHTKKSAQKLIEQCLHRIIRFTFSLYLQ